MIPLLVVHRSVRGSGPQPTLLSGYGGYGTTNGPVFRPGLGVWLEQGGTFVVANIRGGGEFGEAWHLAGNLTRKQTVFDDFIASAEHLIATGYTTPQQLAIIGGSNGGLLMGAALTQRPDLFRAVVSFVGIYDMLRVERSPNGSFNVPEFGTVENPEHFRAMYAYSPYHHVKDGVRYPPTLFLTGANDPRVDPMQSRKMTARLQAAAPDSRILLRTSAAAGHGFGTAQSEAIAEDVDVYAFLLKELGMSYRMRGNTTN
jgi:prolyl oligopeptidase